MDCRGHDEQAAGGRRQILKQAAYSGTVVYLGRFSLMPFSHSLVSRDVCER